jgi:hypothetical protein
VLNYSRKRAIDKESKRQNSDCDKVLNDERLADAGEEQARQEYLNEKAYHAM